MTATAKIKITRIYTDADGKSCFAEEDRILHSAGPIGLLSPGEKVVEIVFRRTPGDYDYAWHNPPRRQYVIILKGRVEMTVSSGDSRCFGPGDVVLLEDLHGQGHYSRAVAGEERDSIFVALA